MPTKELRDKINEFKGTIYDTKVLTADDIHTMIELLVSVDTNYVLKDTFEKTAGNNATNIATNTANISNNTTNISTNTASIEALRSDLDAMSTNIENIEANYAQKSEVPITENLESKDADGNTIITPVVPIRHGGTGAKTKAEARAALGVPSIVDIYAEETLNLFNLESNDIVPVPSSPKDIFELLGLYYWKRQSQKNFSQVNEEIKRSYACYFAHSTNSGGNVQNEVLKVYYSNNYETVETKDEDGNVTSIKYRLTDNVAYYELPFNKSKMDILTTYIEDYRIVYRESVYIMVNPDIDSATGLPQDTFMMQPDDEGQYMDFEIDEYEGYNSKLKFYEQFCFWSVKTYKVEVTWHQENGEWEFVHSLDRNAYPHTGLDESEKFKYMYLGSIYENALKGMGIIDQDESDTGSITPPLTS